MQRLTRWARDHVANSAAQQVVPERECVFRGGDDQQHGWGFAEHLGRVLQPERGTQHRRRHQQLPGPRAELIKPPLHDTVNPLRQLSRTQHGTAAGDLHGALLAQAADQLGDQRGVPGGTTGQGQQGLVRWRAERVRDQGRHRVITKRGQHDTSSSVLLQQAEQVFRVVLRCAGPGQDPRDRVPLQVPWQCPQRGQRGRAGPLQVIQAHQDRNGRGPLFQVRSYLADPPCRRLRQIMIMAIRGEPGERLAQGRAQRGERDRPAQLVRCSRRQGKTLPRGLAGGAAEQQGLADARLPLHQHHTAQPPLSAPQQVTNYLLLRVTSAHHLIAGRSHRRRCHPARSRRGVSDHRCHINRLALHVFCVRG